MRNGAVREEGTRANVLGSPLPAIAHLPRAAVRALEAAHQPKMKHVHVKSCPSVAVIPLSGFFDLCPRS